MSILGFPAHIARIFHRILCKGLDDRRRDACLPQKGRDGDSVGKGIAESEFLDGEKVICEAKLLFQQNKIIFYLCHKPEISVQVSGQSQHLLKIASKGGIVNRIKAVAQKMRVDLHL